MNINKYQQISINIFVLLFCITNIATAAVLYLEPSSGTYHQDNTFLVEIRLDTQGEYINTVEANLIFSSDILEVRDLSQGNSVLTLWVKEPSVTEDSPLLGLISFIGGVPGGYQGKDGLLLKIVFQAKEVSGGLSSAKVEFLDSCRVLLNDGLGTRAKLTTKGTVFTILPEKLEISKNEWQEEISKDKSSPQPFKIEISRDLSIFDGKYFIIFSTTDKETGIDHYEVKEGEKDWEKANSPHVLENQKLTADVWVKAIDKAGNEWMETLKAPNSVKIRWEIYVVLGLTLIGVIIITWMILKKLARYRSRNL